jgi:hypothetical protein
MAGRSRSKNGVASHPLGLVEDQHLHVVGRDQALYLVCLLIGDGRTGVGFSVGLPLADRVRQAVTLGCGVRTKCDAGHGLASDFPESMGALGQEFDLGRVPMTGHADGERLDDAAGTDMKLPGQRTGGWQQAPFIEVEQGPGLGSELELPCLGVVRIRGVDAVGDGLDDWGVLQHQRHRTSLATRGAAHRACTASELISVDPHIGTVVMSVGSTPGCCGERPKRKRRAENPLRAYRARCLLNRGRERPFRLDPT